MGPIIAWMFVAILAAVGVLVVAGSSQRGSGFGAFLGELRGGLSARRATGTATSGSVAAHRAQPAMDTEPVDADIEDLFSLGQTSQAAYVSVEEIQDALVRARDAAARRIPILNR